MEKKVCFHCGQEIPESAVAFEIDGEYFCFDCFNEHVHLCGRCETWFYDHGHPVHSHYGNVYCESCFKATSVPCAICGNPIPVWRDRDLPTWNICTKCFIDNYTMCDRCKRVEKKEDTVQVVVNEFGDTETWCKSHANNARFCAECDRFVVPELYDPIEKMCIKCIKKKGVMLSMSKHSWKAPREIKNYSYKPVPIFAPYADPSEFFIGYELEIESDGDEDKKWWANYFNDATEYTYAKRDGSLDNGIEFVSHPATLEYHMSKKPIYETLFKVLTDNGFTSHDAGTCGLHFHVSTAPIEARNPHAVHNMLLLFDRFWEHLKKFSRRTEESLDHYARRYAAKLEPYERVKDNCKGTEERYMAINLQNEHTIEFRIFRGTLNLETFFASMQFVQVFVEKCIALKSEDEARKITWEDLVSSDYPELNAYLERRGLTGNDEPIEEPIEETPKPSDDIVDEFLLHIFDRGDRVVTPYGLGTVEQIDGGNNDTCTVLMDYPEYYMNTNPDHNMGHLNIPCQQVVRADNPWKAGDIVVLRKNGNRQVRHRVRIQ